MDKFKQLQIKDEKLYLLGVYQHDLELWHIADREIHAKSNVDQSKSMQDEMVPIFCGVEHFDLLQDWPETKPCFVIEKSKAYCEAYLKLKKISQAQGFQSLLSANWESLVWGQMLILLLLVK